jgi:DNA-binding NarL/FixJ family response regulator
MMRPLLVVEASSAAFERAVRDAERAGAHVVRRWSPDASLVCAGVVRDGGDAAEALLAVVGGAGLVVHAQAPREVVDRLVDDLRRFGAVDHRLGEPDTPIVLPPEERALLAALADGRTLGDAAAQLNMSRRTADRRLQSARRRLGAATTAEMLVAYEQRTAAER